MNDSLSPSADFDTVLQRRIKERLDALRRSARDVSLKAGLGPDAIRTILAGRSRSPRAENLAAIANELQCEVGYLLGTVDHPWLETELRRSEDGTLVGVMRLDIENVLSFSWTSEAETLYGERPSVGFADYVSDVYSVSTFLPGPQHLEQIVDDHANSIFPKGSFLHCLNCSGGEVKLHDMDIIILERFRSEEPHVQRTVRRVRLFNDRALVLQTMTANTDMLEEIQLEHDPISGIAVSELHRERGEAFTIAAIVLRGIQHVSGPGILQMVRKGF